MVGYLAIEIVSDWKEEVSGRFLQAMANAMGMSFYKYGKLRDAYPKKVNAIATLKDRLAEYEKTGNADYLIDVANMAMIEFEAPAHKDFHYSPGDSNKSIGRRFHGELDRSHRHNKEI